MVVDHTHSLQERINDRGTDEAHAPAFQVWRYGQTALCGRVFHHPYSG